MKTFWVGFEKRAMSLPSGKGILKAVSGGLEKATEKATHVPKENVLDYRLFNKAKPAPTTINYAQNAVSKNNPAYQAAAEAKHQAISKARMEQLKRQGTPQSYWHEALKEPVQPKA